MQQVVLGPIAVEMAVGVVAVWDREQGSVRQAGFSYATVEGHAERGVASFAVRYEEGQSPTILIEARLRPGTLLTGLGRPVARLFQRGLTLAAVRRLSQ